MNILSPFSFSLGALIASQTMLRVVCATQPFPMPHQLAALLDHPLRQQYRNVSETLAHFGFAAGQSVLDLGCGTGTFTLEMARMVGERGTVHAVDLQRPLLDQTRQRAEQAGLAERIRMHHAGAYQLPLADESIDLAVIIATLGEIDDKVRVLGEVRRLLKAGGRVAISEELLDPGYLPAHLVQRAAAEAEFHFVGKIGTPFCYSLIFEHR